METYLEALAHKHAEEFGELYRDYIEEMITYLVQPPSKAESVMMAEAIFHRYLEADAHWGYLIHAEGQAIGFCLVRRYPSEDRLFDMEQFYISPMLRRSGVGQSALGMALRCFPGAWQVRVMKTNAKALKFWKQALDRYASEGLSVTRENEDGLDMYFMRFTAESSYEDD